MDPTTFITTLTTCHDEQVVIQAFSQINTKTRSMLKIHQHNITAVENKTGRLHFRTRSQHHNH